MNFSDNGIVLSVKFYFRNHILNYFFEPKDTSMYNREDWGTSFPIRFSQYPFFPKYFSQTVFPNIHFSQNIYAHGPFTNYLQIACHKAKIKEETHAGHRIQIFLMFFDEIQMIFMVLVPLHYVHGHEILNCTLI